MNMTPEEKKAGEFLLAHGGPFYELQRLLGLLRDDAFRAGSRALLFVSIAWGVPLVFSLVAGSALGPVTDGPYLYDLVAWARFFIAIGLFLLMEKTVEEQLCTYLLQFVRAPLLAPGSLDAAAAAVTRALKRRDARTAEAACLVIALFGSLATYFRLLDHDSTNWAVQVAATGNSLTLAGWWAVLVSNTIFIFLLLRWLWRLCVWGLLLRELAGLELRLVATHPDGHGGLAFLGQYPNAYAAFVFAVSCVLGATVAHALMDATLTATTYSILMTSWLVLIFVLFAIPLLAFNKPLGRLKEKTLLAYSTRSTQHYRASERELLGRNIVASEDGAEETTTDIPDPVKAYTATRKLSGMVVNRATLLPLSIAALLPLVAAGTTQLPLKEMLKVVKRLLLL
jgi:hypothetical protein